MSMFAQTIRRSLLETRSAAALPPTFLLPLRARLSTASHTTADGLTVPLSQSANPFSAEDYRTAPASTATPAPATAAPAKSTKLSHSVQNVVTDVLPAESRKLLPLLQSQPAHYLTIHIHGHPYLVTRGDTVRLPFLMPKVHPGDVLRLNRATHIGSRDYTLKAPEPSKGTRDGPKKIFYLDERLFTCRATVMGVESEPMRIMEKTKRRQRHVKTVKSKHRYTILRISDVEVRGLEEYERLIKET